MTKLPVVSGKECISRLLRLGFVIKRRKSSHVIMEREDGEVVVVVPMHKEIKPGLLRAIIRDADITVDEFVRAK